MLVCERASKSYPCDLRDFESSPNVGKVLFIVLQGSVDAVPQEGENQQVAGNEGSHMATPRLHL